MKVKKRSELCVVKNIELSKEEMERISGRDRPHSGWIDVQSIYISPSASDSTSTNRTASVGSLIGVTVGTSKPV